MVPPGRVTRTISSALSWWCGANMTPTQDSTAFELVVVERERLRIGLAPIQRHPAFRGILPTDIQQLRRQVGCDDAGQSRR